VGNVGVAVGVEEVADIGQTGDAAAAAEMSALHGGHGVGKSEDPGERPAAQLAEGAGTVKNVAGAVGVNDLDPEP
jgi:hypothetical protein